MNMESKHVFHEKLRKVMAAKGLTRTELAKRAGVPRSVLHNYEFGINLPTLANFRALGEALEVPLDYLAGLESGPRVIEVAAAPKDDWTTRLRPKLESLDKAGRDAVESLVEGLTSDNPRCSGPGRARPKRGAPRATKDGNAE